MTSDIGISYVCVSFVESQSDQAEIYKQTINTLMGNVFTLLIYLIHSMLHIWMNYNAKQKTVMIKLIIQLYKYDPLLQCDIQRQKSVLRDFKKDYQRMNVRSF